jgi:RNA polymerase sigma-70 factor (ECF subfamily)
MKGVQHERFDRLYEEHAAPLLAFLTYRTGSRPLAEDILADTFERVLTARRRFDPRKGSEKTWLYTIALNLLRDHARRATIERRFAEQAVPAHVAGHSGGFDAVEDREALGQAMQALSDEEREVVALRYGSELTVPEIAKLLDEKLTTVEGRVYRALRKLRDELDAAV